MTVDTTAYIAIAVKGKSGDLTLIIKNVETLAFITVRMTDTGKIISMKRRATEEECYPRLGWTKAELPEPRTLRLALTTACYFEAATGA